MTDEMDKEKDYHESQKEKDEFEKRYEGGKEVIRHENKMK